MSTTPKAQPGDPLAPDPVATPTGPEELPAAPPEYGPASVGAEIIHRHGVTVRITHWINVVAVSLLLMSGLQIFNAHPRLYWGAQGTEIDPAWLSLDAVQAPDGRLTGVTRLGAWRFDTTGVLGVSAAKSGAPMARGWPAWATLPSWQDLANGRRWHFLFAWVLVANGLAYLASGVLGGHFHRDLAPTAAEMAPASLWRSILDHALLKHPTGEAARRYNVLQKLAYLAVAFLFLPAMVLTGLAMSPGFDAFAPWLVQLLGGRQSARSLHFIFADLIVLFVIVHLVEVVLAGAANEIGSMITGRYRLRQERRR